MTEEKAGAITAAQADRIIGLLEALQVKVDAISGATASTNETMDWLRRRVEATERFQEDIHSRSKNFEVMNPDGTRRPL